MRGRTPMRLPAKASRRLAESFVLQVAPDLQRDFSFAVLVPWEGDAAPPANVVLPDPTSTAVWDPHELIRAANEHNGVFLVAATFETQYETKVLKRMIEELASSDVATFIVIGLQLVKATRAEDMAEESRDHMQTLLMRNECMLSSGCSAVILDPDPDCRRLKLKVQQALVSIEVDAAHVNQIASPDASRNLQQIEQQHRQLLWQNVPKLLMPAFPAEDPSIVEQSQRVGCYQLLKKYPTRSSINSNGSSVLLALRDDDRKKVVIKTRDKSEFVTAFDLESIYREHCFLSDPDLRHPNIIRCIELFHSPSRIYFVMEYGGMRHLGRAVQDNPGARLGPVTALSCARQVASALAHCHSRNIVHRSVSLNHIAVEDTVNGTESDRLMCRLLDFHTAVKCSGQGSSVIFGDVPFIAPEMATGGPFALKPVDCWSMGVVLLEAIGGLESLATAVGYRDEDDLETCGTMISRYFSQDCSHAEAMSKVGGVQSDDALLVLEAALTQDAKARATMDDLQRILNLYQPRETVRYPGDIEA